MIQLHEISDKFTTLLVLICPALFFARPFFARPLSQICLIFERFCPALGPKFKFGAMVSEQIKLMLMIFLPKTLILFHDKMIVPTF